MKLISWNVNGLRACMNKGFDAFYRVINKYHPKYFVHGHMHMNYGRDIPREDFIGDTKVINAYERYIVEVPEPEKKRKFWERMNKRLYPKDYY